MRLGLKNTFWCLYYFKSYCFLLIHQRNIYLIEDQKSNIKYVFRIIWNMHQALICRYRGLWKKPFYFTSYVFTWCFGNTGNKFDLSAWGQCWSQIRWQKFDWNWCFNLKKCTTILFEFFRIFRIYSPQLVLFDIFPFIL